MEQDIIRQVQNGDTAAFEYLVQAYQRPLFVLISNLLRHSHRIEDVAQEVFLAAYQHIGTYRSNRGKFSTWLFRIARNKCLNELRKKREITIDGLPELESNGDPSVSLLEKETFHRLDQALDRFSVQDRSIFILAEIEEMSYADIADIENIKLGTVKSRLSRIRGKLRAILNDARA